MSRALFRTPALLLLLVFASFAAERVDLNGLWQFRLDGKLDGEAQGWFGSVPAGVETVSVPHTWNIGKYEDVEGKAWYFRTFDLPAGALGKHLELHFGGTFYKARVWVNGVEAGGHEGGHTAWYVDITALAKARNTIAIEVDNRPGFATIPGYAMDLGRENVWYDWWHYGGIVRDVWMTVNEQVVVRRQHIRSQIQGTNAQLSDEIFLENFSKQATTVRLRATLQSPDAYEKTASAPREVSVPPGRSSQRIEMTVERVKLWHFDTPNVYRMEAELIDSAGNTIDSIADNYGFRTLVLRDRHLYLNGERVRLSGMTRHAESAQEGLAETRGTMLRDYTEMKELQVTLTRPVHYPQHDFVLDFCDRNGILLIPEIPIWHFSEKQFTDPKVIALAKQMMTEMIEQNWNHPAVFGWSVCNESSTNTPGGVAYFRSMYDVVKKLDPDRYVSYADDRIINGADAKANAGTYADFLMINEYAGTWHGDPGKLGPELERAGRDYPGKMVIISEFGVAGMFAKDKIGGDTLRRKIISEHLALFQKYDFVGGAILWCYQDYRSHRNLRPGETSGYVEMGIVDENRQRYPSFYLWKVLNSPAESKLAFRFAGDSQTPAGFRIEIARRPESAMPSYALHGYTALWEVRDGSNALIAKGEKRLDEIGAAQTIEQSFAAPKATELHLIFKLMRPTGFAADEKTIDWSAGASGGDTVSNMEKRGYIIP